MAKFPKIPGEPDGHSKEWRELAPKMPDDEFIPKGAITFREFRDQLGKALFPDDWTGEECAEWLAGSLGSVHRSEAERDADRSPRRAQAVMQYECAGYPVPPSLRSWSSPTELVHRYSQETEDQRWRTNDTNRKR